MIIFSLFAFIAISKANTLTSNITSINIIQGTNSNGVTVKIFENKTVEILWREKFNYTNSLKVYSNYFFENTGERKINVIDNLCHKYKKGSHEYAVQHYILEKLGNTKDCPIKKGTRFTLTPPIINSYSINSKHCGPALWMINIFRNNPKNPKVTPLIISALLRGTVTGSHC